MTLRQFKNLSRRASAEDQWNTKSTQFMKCKKDVNIATFNARTLNSASKTGELVDQASLHNIHVAVTALQEHRMVHDDMEVKFQNLTKGWQLITSFATRNSINAAVGGVGFLLNPRASRSLSNVQKISPRIMLANFSGSPATTVIC